MENTVDDVRASLASPRKRRKKKKKKAKDLFNLPGVRKIFLSELTQKIIACTVGDDVTAENPWKTIRKELIQDNLELHEESSDFLPIRMEIIQYPRNEMLIGYIADETKEGEDEFYICVTEEAADSVNAIIERIRHEQETRLHYQLFKDIHPWESMGTEDEIEQELIKYSRPLIEVEVESRYPIFPDEAEFRIVPAEERRDGYMELKCVEDNLVNVYMRRIDTSIQVAPQCVEDEAQTNCGYPKNSTTQYLYEIPKVESLTQQIEAENYKDLADLLEVNSAINLYINDFKSLAVDSTTEEERTSWKDYEEFMFFTDVDLCKGKMISSICWHPMWTGVIAIAYCDISPYVFRIGRNKEDLVYKAVHGLNLVLLWSVKDSLKPRLILETPREICSVSFCKFDENILIGGCQNGQIVIWDIRNKLQKVEEKEVLTIAQQKYRTYMNSLMKWMKNIHDFSVVRLTAVSDLRYSHRGPVTHISWMDPFFEFSKIGKIAEIDESKENNHSMQLITSSLDGTVLIWDLKVIPVFKAGSYRPKKLRRLQKRPSALEMDVSPYRVLHLNLKPIYKIHIYKRGSGNKPSAIIKSTTSFCRTQFVEAYPDKSRKFRIADRIYFKPLMEKMKTLNDILPQMKIGTVTGSFMEISWEGHDFDSGDIVNSEESKQIFYGRYHDGPVNAVVTSPDLNVTLTVGGKIFAIWRKDLPDRPIIWRRNRENYVKGDFDRFQPFKIIILTITGLIQKWALILNSKEPYYKQSMSNSFLTVSQAHPFTQKKNLYGFGDEQGAFRIYFVPDSNSRTDEIMKYETRLFLDREVNRKLLFYKWQAEFNKRKTESMETTQEIDEKEPGPPETEQVEEKPLAKPIKPGPQPGKYIEWVIEQRQTKQREQIKAMIINKKQLDTKELEKRRKPLQKLEEENERKIRKQKERLKQGDHIFQETVASLFPDAIKKKPSPPMDPYAGGYPVEEKGDCYKEYVSAVDELEQFVLSNRYQYDFSYKNLLVAARNKHINYKSRNDIEEKDENAEVDEKREQEDDEKIRDEPDENLDEQIGQNDDAK